MRLEIGLRRRVTPGRRLRARVTGIAFATAAVCGAPTAAQVAGGDAVEVPLRAEGGRMVVPVRTQDGVELSFVVSTGSAVTVLAESAAGVLDDGGVLTLGGLPVPLDGARTIPDASLRSGDAEIAGMISSNMLNAFDVLFDLPGGRMVLKPVGRSVSWEGENLSEPVRLRVFHGIVLGLDVEVNGRSYPAMLELGSPGILVNERVIEEAALLGGRAERLQVGATTFTDVEATVTDHPVVRRFSPNGDGFVLVGTAVSMDCAVSVSWAHRELRTCVR